MSGQKVSKEITIIQAIKDERLFGSLFKDLSTWRAWMVWLKAVFALPMTASEQETFKKCTGRNRLPSREPRDIFTIIGRRGGKSFISALTACFVGSFGSFKKYLSPGERAVILVLARDREQARVVFSYVRGIFEAVKPLRSMIVAERADEIELRNNATIMVKTSDYRSIRGITLALAILDELAFWDSQGVNPDRQVVASLKPGMATIPNAKILAISTPYARAGSLFEAHREFYGQEDSDTLIWKASSIEMNPTLSKTMIQKEMESDPDAARSEWLAEFRENVQAAFPLDAIEACVIPGRVELPPSTEIPYMAFADPSGGRHDSFSLCIAHRHDEMAVVDLIREWKPPFDPSVVVSECAGILKSFGVYQVFGDKYAAEWPVEAFRKEGIEYRAAEKNKSELYLNLIPIVCAKRVELPDSKRLIQQLRRLERRRGRTGKDSIDHPANGADDLSNSLAGAVVMALDQQPLDISSIELFGQTRSSQWLDVDAVDRDYGSETLADYLDGITMGKPDW